MKTIGLIGGMSWESSIEYYRIINETVKEKLGSLHSAKSLMVSVDFAEIEKLQREDRWEEAGEILAKCAQALERGGADFIVLCSNTMHKLADQMMAGVTIPLLHIADAAAERIMAAGVKKIGLLGTRFTMEQDFYKRRLSDKFGLEVLIPDKFERQTIDRVIFEELVQGKVLETSRAEYKRIMEALAARGAEGILLGCTEIELLVKRGDCQAPLFATTSIHAAAAVEYALR
ncbi:MAG: aspartate/glutamate racemase family protein [Chloroflexi bacterium]|nr:aspartate/glutamate racemase family protein [Chloroflexota bacterium]MCA2002848.1 aspartate/glutamate racemase family protein [Chloroflexota bacterium]